MNRFFRTRTISIDDQRTGNNKKKQRLQILFFLLWAILFSIPTETEVRPVLWIDSLGPGRYRSITKERRFRNNGKTGKTKPGDSSFLFFAIVFFPISIKNRSDVDGDGKQIKVELEIDCFQFIEENRPNNSQSCCLGQSLEKDKSFFFKKETKKETTKKNNGEWPSPWKPQFFGHRKEKLRVP